MYAVSWKRYEATALADASLAGGALVAALEDYVRVRNPQLTDLRLEHATPTDRYDTGGGPRGRWYDVTYLADNT